MKKILLPLLAVVALLTACEEEHYDAPQLQKGVTFTVPDFIDETATRVDVTIDNSGANFTWTAGDTLGVFPQNGYQTAFPISGGMGTNTAIFDGADWALRPNASYAAYYPFVPGMNFGKDSIYVSYLGQTQNGNGSTAHLGKYDYLAAKYTTVSSSGDVNFTLNHLGCLVRFQLTMPEADTYSSMTLSCEGSMLTTAGKFDLTAATPALTVKRQDASISLALNNIATTEDNQVLTLYMMLPPMDLSGKNLSIKVSGEKDYETTVSGKDMKAGSIYGYSNAMTTPALMHNGHDYVDLGLTSNGKPIYWATCNVGATQPEEYGDYFAWGETEGYNSGKTSFSWSTYKYCNNGSWTGMTKYTYPDGQTSGNWYSGSIFIGDNKTILDASDDAATANWGGSWRMPTMDELNELCNNCTWTWTTKNGVNGYNVVGPNGNSIFLPAAGGCGGSGLAEAGSYGFYWSSSLGMDSYVACRLFFNSGTYNLNLVHNRYIGQSVRPVCQNEVVLMDTSGKVYGDGETMVLRSFMDEWDDVVIPSPIIKNTSSKSATIQLECTIVSLPEGTKINECLSGGCSSYTTGSFSTKSISIGAGQEKKSEIEWSTWNNVIKTNVEGTATITMTLKVNGSKVTTITVQYIHRK